jgi:toxin ParE1/3/4
LKRRVILHPQAEADIVEARSWYEQRRPGLGREFLDSVQTVLVALGERPAQYPVVHRNVRRALVRRFPYGVFYVPSENDILVIACFHAKRDPRLIVNRMR